MILFSITQNRHARHLKVAVLRPSHWRCVPVFFSLCCRDCFALCLLNSGTSIFAGFTVFSVLGFMAHELELPVEEVATAGELISTIILPLLMSAYCNTFRVICIRLQYWWQQPQPMSTRWRLKFRKQLKCFQSFLFLFKYIRVFFN